MMLGTSRFLRVAAMSAAFLLPLGFQASAQNCSGCHGLPGVTSPEGKPVYVDTSAYRESAHGTLSCTACHRGDWSYPHAVRQAPLKCGQCHAKEQEEYRQSLHGREAAAGNPDVPGCADCHGIHNVMPMARLIDQRKEMQNLLLDKCVECHTNPDLMRKYGIPLDRFATYEASAHGRADRFGSVAVARCATCHGSHAILPPENPNSSVNPKNLAKTCGRCHENPERFVGRRYHLVSEAAPSPQSYNAVLRGYYWVLLAFGGVATVFFAIASFRGE